MIVTQNHQFVWHNGTKYQIVPGGVNEAARYVSVFLGDYESFGNPASNKCISFDEIEKAE